MTDAGDIARMKRIAARIRERGVKVVFVNGWDQRGGTFPVVPNAAFVHHDASATTSGTWGALGIITHGRAGVPPPLSQFQVARGNVAQVAIVAAGIANHAGRGGPLKGLPKDNANRETYGTEVANNGVGERYSDATIHAIRAVQASIAEESHFGPDMVIGHKEWAPTRKIDPTYSMDWMRGLVTDTMQGDDMPLSNDDIERIANAAADKVWAKKLALWAAGKDAPNEMHAGQQLNQSRGYSDRTATAAFKTLALVRNIATQIEGIEVDVDEAEIVRGVLSGLAAQLTPQEIAAEIAQVLPPTLAKQVITELGNLIPEES